MAWTQILRGALSGVEGAQNDILLRTQTPAARPMIGRSFSWRACVSPSTKLRTGSASWLVSPYTWRPINLMRPGGASLVLGPFAPQQRTRPSGCAKQNPRLPGRNPATQNITWTREWETHVRGGHLPASVFFLANPKIDFRYTLSSCKARTINSK